MIATQSKKVSPYLFDGKYRPFTHSAKTGRPKKNKDDEPQRTGGAAKMAKRLRIFRAAGKFPVCNDNFKIVPSPVVTRVSIDLG